MSSSRKVKFVATDNVGLPIKRKQVSNACDECRAKKRRCNHHQRSTSGEPPAEDARQYASPTAHRGSSNSVILPPIVSPQGQGTSDGTSGDTSHSRRSPYGTLPNMASIPQPAPASHRRDEGHSTRPQSSRFVGDLNPEGMFMEATGSASGRQSSQKGDVGIWLSSGTVNGTGQPSQFITSRPPPMMDQFLAPFVREHCLSRLPPEDDWFKLKGVFLQNVHPLFPIIPEYSLEGSPQNPSNVVLRQLVCLAAGTDPAMAPHLRLQSRGKDLLSAQDFSQSLSSAVRAILETSMITDRVLHIRALTMLSLYTQPTCPEEADLPAQLGGRAIHHIQTLGLHLLKYDGPNQEELITVFCAVWALDRINAAVHGRPCLIHERDIGANLDACMKKQPPCFRLMLYVCYWLDQVVELYRPGPSAEVSGLEKVAYIDLPVLEAMIVDADALKVPSSLIATIETFYHTVIILSCRLPRPGTAPAASTLPPPSANARRSLAAERIACAVPRDHLSPVPLVPYAVSLALSVEYRKMRHSRLPMFRARAMNSFRRNCEMLRGFADYFWSAKVMAGLGERVLKEMERAATTLTRETSPSASGGTPRPSAMDGQSQQQPELTSSNAGAVNAAADMNNMVDFSLIDAISGQDVFGHMDPNFDLNAVEDALEANLDIGLPLNWGDWGQFASPNP